MAAAVVDQAEEGEKLGPCPIAMVHGVGVPSGVFPQPLEEAGDGVEVLVHLVVRQQRTVFGVEQKNQPQQHGEQAAIDVVRVVGKHGAQQFAMPLVVSRLEAAEQLVECGQHLLGQLGRDKVLIFAAFRKDRGQSLFFRKGEKPFGRKEHLQGGEDRTSGDFRHLPDVECRVAGGFALRRIDQPELRAVGKDADRHLRAAEQALESRLGAGVPSLGFVAAVRGIVEVDSCFDTMNEQ